jgi:hypothetical protein
VIDVDVIDAQMMSGYPLPRETIPHPTVAVPINKAIKTVILSVTIDGDQDGDHAGVQDRSADPAPVTRWNDQGCNAAPCSPAKQRSRLRVHVR